MNKIFAVFSYSGSFECNPVLKFSKNIWFSLSLHVLNATKLKVSTPPGDICLVFKNESHWCPRSFLDILAPQINTNRFKKKRSGMLL